MTHVIGPGVTTFPKPSRSQSPHPAFVSQKILSSRSWTQNVSCSGLLTQGDSGTKTVSFTLDPAISKLAPTMPCPLGVVAVTSSELDGF